MKKLTLIVFIFISFLFTFCSSESVDDSYNNAVKLLSEKKYDEAVVIFDEIVADNEESEFAPKALFETAKVYQGQVIKNLSSRESLLKAVSVYKKIFSNYPKSKEAENALFMSGFILANELNDLDGAKETYELFIEKFPNGSLADDAKVELENLGKTPEEILMEKVQ